MVCQWDASERLVPCVRVRLTVPVQCAGYDRPRLPRFSPCCDYECRLVFLPSSPPRPYQFYSYPPYPPTASCISMSAEGSEDAHSSSDNVHLLVLIHGMWGNPSHLAEMHRIVKEKRAQPESEQGPGGETLHVLLAETNRDDGTYDGIDWGGERVAEEVSGLCSQFCACGTGFRRCGLDYA